MGDGKIRLRFLASAAVAALTLGALVGCTETTGGPTPPVGDSPAAVVLADGLQALSDANRTGSVDTYRRAISYLGTAFGDSSTARDASLPLGEAHLKLAELTNDLAEFRAAESTFATVAGMGDQRRPDLLEADARLNRAQALTGIFNARRGTQEATDALNDAIEEYGAAIDEYEGLMNANQLPADGRFRLARAQFGLARAYLGRGNAGDDALARTALNAGSALGLVEGGTPDELLELAKVQAEVLGDPPQDEASDVVLRTLRQAASIGGGPDVHAMLGERYFQRAAFLGGQDYGPARSEFASVAAQGSGAGGATLADALYYLSVIDTQGAASDAALDAAISDAKRAVQLGGGDFRYRRQVCLLTIKRGRVATSADVATENQVLNDELSNWCRSNNDQPEGRLMSGMSYIRQAQYVSAGSRTQAQTFLSARNEFVAGAGMLQSLPVQERSIQWPGWSEALPIADFFEFGDKVVVEQCANQVPRPASEARLSGQRTLAEMGELFGQYKAFACYP